jgi:hypothetical protein
MGEQRDADRMRGGSVSIPGRLPVATGIATGSGEE